jgi:uncharacterized protein YecT (DUF1311 family)
MLKPNNSLVWIISSVILWIDWGLADSPLTSTPFSKAYPDVEIVQSAANRGTMNEEIAQYLSAPANPVDVKAAVVNALSWGDRAGENARFYLEYLKKTCRQTNEPELIGQLGGDELLCLGYLRALADYFRPENTLPLLKQARIKKPQSLTFALVAMLVEAEVAMGSDWCKVWRLTENTLNDQQLQWDMRREAIEIMENYLVNYREYCPEEGETQNQPAAEADPCANARTQLEMNECAIKEYKAADAELNRVYKEVIAALRPEMQEKLRAAQRAWITYRDANCDCAAFEYTGGSIYPLMYYSCLRDMTITRTQKIRQLLEP